MSEHDVCMRAGVHIVIDDNCDAITRITGPDGDEWRKYMYDFHTEEDVLNHFADNALRNDVEDASRLDGWADLPPGAATMRVEWCDPDNY